MHKVKGQPSYKYVYCFTWWGVDGSMVVQQYGKLAKYIYDNIWLSIFLF